MATLLISGSTGFLGGHLLKALPQGQNVTLFTRDTRDSDLPRMDGGVLFHLAAESTVAKCTENPALARQNNVELTKRMIDIASNRGLMMVYISTDLVFEGAAVAPPSGFSIEDTPFPLSVYAKTKREGEMIVLEAGGIVVRVSLLYGAPQGARGGFLGWMREALKSGKKLELFRDEYRTPVFAADVSKALLQISGKREDLMMPPSECVT